MNTSSMYAAMQLELIIPADQILAQHLLTLEQQPVAELGVLIALTSAALREGHVCLWLDDSEALRLLGINIKPECLLQSSLIGGPNAHETPLILADGGLYLARYYAWVQQIINALKQLQASNVPELDRDLLRAGLDKLFNTNGSSGKPDWQRAAATLALLKRLCVISGGPGTGKTYTVARILRLLLDQHADSSQGAALQIALAAPTGKAAGGLSESLAAADTGLSEYTAKTLHHLLGMRPGRVMPRYHRGNRLPFDVVIIDEVSMVDLPMLARLLDALADKARLILLGDRFQLGSIEVGQVMADLCGAGGNVYSPELVAEIADLSDQQLPLAASLLVPMNNHVIDLQHSRRFDANKGIGLLAAAINSGDSKAVIRALESDNEQLDWQSNQRANLEVLLKLHLLPLFEKIRQTGNPADALVLLNEFRVLCAVHNGPQGVNTINRLLERLLGVDDRQIYHGKPIMITSNYHEQNLYNGDIGLILKDEQGDLRAWFQAGDGVRAILPSRLPTYQTVYAMTIHKSQGSEFNQLMLILPEQESPVVTRELLYTGITRAREKVIVCANSGGLKTALKKREDHRSSLRQALWECVL